MHYEAGEIYHILNRGNNRQRVFFEKNDYRLFVQKIREQLLPCCSILTWCLMPNHYHLMIQATDISCVERDSFGGKPMQTLPYRLGVLQSSYTRQVNRRLKATGSLWQQKALAISMTVEMQRTSFPGNREKFIVRQMHYHHQNPLRAGLAPRMEDWTYSSFRDYAGLRAGTLCDKGLLMTLTDYDMSDFYADSYAAWDRYCESWARGAD